MAERFGQDIVLLEKLAAGGMAEVYRAKQLGYAGFEKTVAVKRILQNFVGNDEFKAMFRMEANLSGQFQHSNIVHVFSNGEFQEYLYLVMEFVDGRNARQLLARADKKKVKIPIEISAHLIAETAKGLDYAHSFVDEKTGQPLEVVHRDMSPQNIMLGYDGSVKVVDFGIAKAAARTTQTRAGVLKGKFGYMSPEQAQGMKLDRRTDIFALGIILFELLTQRRLFTSDDDMRTLQLVKECRVPRPSKYNPNVPPALDNIVLKALKREASERYSTAAELYTDVIKFMHSNSPQFLPSDLSAFLKNLFSEDIVEDRKKREKINSEIPPEMLIPAPKNNGRSFSREKDNDTDQTDVEGEERTKVAAEGASSSKKKNENDEGDSVQMPQAQVQSALAPVPLANIKIVKESEDSLPPPEHILPMDMMGRSAPKPKGSKGRFTIHKIKTKKHWGAVASIIILSLIAYEYITINNVDVSAEAEKIQREMQDFIKGPSNSIRSEDIPSTPAQNSASPVPLPRNADINAQDTTRMPANITKVDTPPTTAQAPVGYLRILSVPKADEIYVDGVLQREPAGEKIQTPLEKFPVSPGSHVVVLRNSLFGVQMSKEVVVESNKIETIDLLLKK